MKLFYENLADRNLTVITASSENAALPVSNLANVLRKRVFESGIETVTTILVDFGFSLTVSDVILLDTDAGDNVPDYKIYSSPDNVTWTNRYDSSFAGGSVQAASFTARTVRYWKIELSRDADTNPITIGRLFIGVPYTTVEPPDYDGATITPTDPSISVASSGGQEYTDMKEHFDLVDLKFTDIPDSQLSTFRSVFDLCGMAVPLFVLIENGFTKYYYVKFTKNPQCRVSNYDGGYRWNVTLNFKEQI
jgi:hypothetical protein